MKKGIIVFGIALGIIVVLILIFMLIKPNYICRHNWLASSNNKERSFIIGRDGKPAIFSWRQGVCGEEYVNY